MGSSQRPSADFRVMLELAGGKAFDGHRKFHIPQLADEKVLPGFGPQPAQEDVAGGLHQALADHDAFSLVVEGALARIWLQHRAARLFDLQQQGIFVVAKEQPDETTRGHAADADDPPRKVFQAVAVEQPAAIVGQRGAVLVDALANQLERPLIGDPRHHGGLLDEVVLAVALHRDLRKQVVADAGASPGSLFFPLFSRTGVGCDVDQIVGADAVIPDFQRA